jgi:hypothetical protein
MEPNTETNSETLRNRVELNPREKTLLRVLAGLGVMLLILLASKWYITGGT